MIKRTKRHIWPVSLAAALAVVGVMAALIVLAYAPGAAQAQTSICDEASGAALEVLREFGLCPPADDGTDPGTDPGNGNGNGTNGNGDDPPVVTMIKSSSESGGASVKLTLTIVDLPNNLNSGSWVEIYLENDYQEPASISRQDVVFIATNADGMGDPATNDGGTVIAADVEIDDGGEIDGEDDAVVISARIPDMNPRDDSFGYPGQGQTLMMIVASSAGIKNPTEETDNSTGYAIVGAGEDRGDVADVKLTDLLVRAKIVLSADDGGRAASLKITGSGFNDGTTASVEVLRNPDGMVDDGAGGTRAISCQDVLATGISLGSAAVGDNDKFELDITVHQDQFKAGAVNYICAKDNEAPTNRFAEKPKVFKLTESLTVSPGSVSSGDEVTIKPRDFPGSLSMVSLGGSKVYNASDDIDLAEVTTSENDFDIDADGSDFTFDMPGGLSGTVQVAVTYYQVVGNDDRTYYNIVGLDDRLDTNTEDDDTTESDDVKTPENVSITVNSAGLSLSSTEVAANATVIISGRGFNDNSCIRTSDITIKDIVSKRLVVDSAGVQTGECTEGYYIQTTSSGEFTATISIWTHDSVDNNPALDDGDYKIEAKDIHGFKGSATVTILEPTVSVMPEMVSPRDFITISGENWPISTADDDHEVKIMVDGRNRSVNIDGNGRFRYEYQLRSNIGIGDEHDVVVEFTSDGGSIEEEATFEVHDAGIMLTPTEAGPGQTISLEIEGMPPYTLVEHVKIDGVDRLGGQNLNTDRHGNVMITGVLVPYLDPGFYPVQVMVGEETRVVQLEVLAEAVVAGVAAALPGAVEDLGENLVRIFHFNTASKVWTFYDPRPEFEGLNTLTELAAGQPYWILVPETQENVVLNGRTRDLTCVGGDCWNQLVW